MKKARKRPWAAHNEFIPLRRTEFFRSRLTFVRLERNEFRSTTACRASERLALRLPDGPR